MGVPVFTSGMDPSLCKTLIPGSPINMKRAGNDFQHGLVIGEDLSVDIEAHAVFCRDFDKLSTIGGGVFEG